MNESELGQCEQYSQMLFGKSLKSRDAEDLVKLCSSFEEFRVRAVLKFSQKTEAAKKVAAHWRASAVKEVESPDANILLHMLENLSQKQNDLERKMRDATAELLDKLKAIDTAATAQAEWRTNIDDMRLQVSALRKKVDHVDEIPAARGRLSK
jgi:hypothetical protein